MIDPITRGLARLIWNLSEWSGIGLGRFAPVVFEAMIGVKGTKINNDGSKRHKECK